MYKAAVCDDDIPSRAYIDLELKKQCELMQLEIHTDTYGSSKDLLEKIAAGVHYDILFLDIDMPDMDGITLGEKIRRMRQDSLIVFISQKDELVYQSLEVRPFRFIRKNFFSQEVNKLVKDLKAELYKEEKDDTVILTTRAGEIYSFSSNRILYVEALGKECKVVTDSSTTTLRYKFTDLEELLSKQGFIKIHRSYLVNFRSIFSIRREEVVLDSGMILPMSRLKLKEVQDRFLEYHVGGEK